MMSSDGLAQMYPGNSSVRAGCQVHSSRANSKSVVFCINASLAFQWASCKDTGCHPIRNELTVSRPRRGLFWGPGTGEGIRRSNCNAKLKVQKTKQVVIQWTWKSACWLGSIHHQEGLVWTHLLRCFWLDWVSDHLFHFLVFTSKKEGEAKATIQPEKNKGNSCWDATLRTQTKSFISSPCSSLVETFETGISSRHIKHIAKVYTSQQHFSFW